MKTAIVSGANGFIGKAVCKALLNRGIKVYALIRNQNTMSDISSSELCLIEVELGDYDRLVHSIPENIDVFYHFAWEGAYGEDLSNTDMQMRNIQYTYNALNSAQKIHCKKFIFAGTINELELLQYFSSIQDIPRANCMYGVSKLTCDFMCKIRAAEMGMHYNTAIIGSCFGPGDKSSRIHNVFITSMIEGVKPRLIEGNCLHDWVYIDDAAEMFYAVGANSLNMKTYYIGHNKLRLFKDILCEVRDILNPGFQITFGEIKSNFYIDYSLIDINSVYEDTGYECKSDFRDCIINTADWLISQQKHRK